MDRLVGRVAVVTGASAGIGEALAKELTCRGMKVAALARRIDRLQKIQDECKHFKGTIQIYKCDVSKDDEVVSTFASIVKDLGPISVMVNNAALLISIPLTDVDHGSPRPIYETNLIGLVTCTQLAITNMRENNIEDGHVIFISSIAGHNVIPSLGASHYCATKHAIIAINEALRNELSELKLNIRVTNISPGLVKTDMGEGLRDSLGHPLPMLRTKDVVDCIIFALSVDTSVNISELIVQPIRETIASFKSASHTS